MVMITPLDPRFPIQRQLDEPETGPLVLINIFTMATLDEDDFLRIWKEDAAYMKVSSGFISTQLHRATGESPTYLNYATWESLAAFRKAFGDPGFRAKLADYPTSVTATPHLFRKVAVSGACVA